MIKRIRFIAATIIISICSVATADETDEANKATRIAYCTTWATEFAKMYEVPPDASPALIESVRAKQVAAERLRQFVQLYLLRVGGSNPNTLSVFAATKNGSTDWQSCKAAINDPSSRACMNEQSQCSPTDSSCVAAWLARCQPAICKRLSDRCLDIDKLLPY